MRNNLKKWIFGAGAHGRITLEVWRSAFPDADFYFIDDNANVQNKIIDGAPVDGGMQFLLKNFSPPDEVIVAMGNNNVRISLGNRLESEGLVLGNAIHTSAVVMKSVKMGGGCMIFAQAVINTNAKIGKHVIINPSVVVEHDSIIEDGVLLGTSVSMGGRVIVEKGAFVGVGTVLAPRIRVGHGTVIGAGSVIVKDIPPGVLAYGVPARVVKQLDETFNWSRLL